MESFQVAGFLGFSSNEVVYWKNFLKAFFSYKRRNIYSYKIMMGLIALNPLSQSWFSVNRYVKP